MLLQLLGLATFGYFMAKWLFAQQLHNFLGKLDRKINRLVNITLIALVVVYALRLLLWWLCIPDFIP